MVSVNLFSRNMNIWTVTFIYHSFDQIYMQESIIIVSLTVLSSLVTIGRFVFEYRKKMSCCTKQNTCDVVVETAEMNTDKWEKKDVETMLFTTFFSHIYIKYSVVSIQD